MGDYIPFLKTKTNEFSALKALDCSIANNMAVFLDIKKIYWGWVYWTYTKNYEKDW